MKYILETITVSNPGKGSGRAANITQTYQDLGYYCGCDDDEKVVQFEKYETIPSESGSIEIWRSLIKSNTQ